MKLLLCFVLVLASAVLLVNAGEGCEKPCPRILMPVSMYYKDGQCKSFANECIMNNAVRCGMDMKSVKFCQRGECGEGGAQIACYKN